MIKPPLKSVTAKTAVPDQTEAGTEPQERGAEHEQGDEHVDQAPAAPPGTSHPACRYG